MKIKIFFAILILFFNDCCANMSIKTFESNMPVLIDQIERLTASAQECFDAAEACNKPFVSGDNVSDEVKDLYDAVKSAIIGD